MIPHKEKGASRIMSAACKAPAHPSPPSHRRCMHCSIRLSATLCRSHQNGKCIDIWIGHHGHDQVMVWDCHDGANQKFWMHEP